MSKAHTHAVLVVEDYDDLRDALVYELKSEGIAAEGASCGADALALLGGGYRPCLVLLDVQMPEMDGWEVCRRLRADAATAAIPVVVLTGDSEALKSATREVAGVLAKPVWPGDLTAAIAAHTRCSRRHRTAGTSNRGGRPKRSNR